MTILTDCVSSAITTTSAVVTVRAFPTVVAYMLSPAAPLLKACAQLAYVFVTLLALRFAGLTGVEILIAYAYLSATSTLYYAVSLRLPGVLQLALALGLFLVLPGLVSPHLTILLLLGWEVALSGYSYCRDAATGARSFADYLFFVFVNPTVCYRDSGRRVSDVGMSSPGLMRVLAGIGALGVSGAIAALRGNVVVLQSSFVISLDAGLRLNEVYAAHWGLGSLQLGLVRQLGYEIPERYPAVFRARTPREFWARWNTYTGAWIRHYVFEPSVRILHRKLAGGLTKNRGRIRVIAMTASFLATGALHDVYSSLARHEVVALTTLWFGLNAFVVALTSSILPDSARTRGGLARLATRVAMLGLAVLFASAFPQ